MSEDKRPISMGEDKHPVEDDIDLDAIVHNAVESVNRTNPRQEGSLRVRLLIFLAALIVVANAVIGIYNSLALRAQVNCNHQLQSTLAQVADQNRNITKRVIDVALSGQNPKTGQPLTHKDLLDIKRQYDQAFEKNSEQRAKLLKTTCT